MMRESERRELLRVKAMIRTGDRAAALSAIDGLTRSKPRHLDPGEQLVLSLVEFHCDRFDVSLSVAECLQRRGAIWPSGRRKGHPKRLECQGCSQGKDNALACPGVVLRSPSQTPEVMPPVQRMAKRARALVGLGWEDPVGLDPLGEASMLTPDDPGDWRT